MLTDGGSTSPLIMHAGDTVTIHAYTTAARDGLHLTVTDRTTGHAGTIVLNSKSDGPLMPAFDTQQIGNALSWGLVNDTPNSFVWEIGHTSPFSSPKSQFCLPGQTFCDSYNEASWLGTQPLQIKGVSFGDGSPASQWAVVSDFGREGRGEPVLRRGQLRQPVLHLPLVHVGDDRLPLRRRLPGRRERLRQG